MKFRKFLTPDPASPTIPTGRNNNFNLLRLILAILVILSHSPELVDGDRHREILTNTFKTISFGELAVHGFFLLSVYLILQSWDRSPKLLSFVKKRVLRIFPGFIAASIVCAFIVGPLGANASEYFSQFNLIEFVKGLVLLEQPSIPKVFSGQPYPLVNGAMWTIRYEFKCYLLVAFFGIFGLVKRWHWLGFTTLTFILYLSAGLLDKAFLSKFHFLEEDPIGFVRLLCFFCVGGCFYFFQKQICYQRSSMAIALLVTVLSLFNFKTARFALPTFGGYALFGFAFAYLPLLNWFKTCSDISYGTYLYGWPFQKLLLWYFPSLSPWMLFPLAVGISAVAGLLSWHLVERPFLHSKALLPQKSSE